MLLKEIVINGFKSFANRTKIDLGPGVTTIVGPNGCGKSNVVDAIRWVLGEQSAKALRGGNMQDVIFSGTDQRAAVGMCEVTLLFTECEKELGTAFNEVEITRRVMRDGASNYYLNGKNCRLKDIQELFMNTGVGRVSYSFMVQGQIDQILSTNPSERRVIFEEAAGITRYKVQRREALSKLDQVDQNLSRVQDVIDEVGRQIGSLKRQASKALRYKRLKHRMSHLEMAYCGYDYGIHQGLIRKLEEQVVGIKEKVEKLQSKQELEEQLVGEKKAERGMMYEALQSRQQEIFELKSQKDQFENKGKLALIRKNDTASRIVEIEREFKDIERQLGELETKAKDDSYFKQLQLNLVISSDETFQEKNKSVEGIQKVLVEAEQSLQSKKREMLQVEGDMNRLRKKNGEMEVVLNTNNNLVEELVFKKKEGETHQNELKMQFEKLQEILKGEEKRQKELEEQVKEKQLELAKHGEGLKEVQKRIQEQDKQVARLNAHVSVLEGLQSKFEGFSDGAKAILQGKLSEVLEKKDYGLLSKWVEVEEPYMKALETLLGQAIDAIALEEMGQVVLVTEKLEAKDLGRACLHVEVGKQFKTQGGEGVALPEFLKKAREVVTIKDGKYKTRWEGLLEGCYFAENLENFLEFWKSKKEFEFQLVATKHGELVDARGLIYGGVKRGKSEGSGFLQREKEIRACKDKVEEQKKIFEELLMEGKKWETQVAEAEEKL
ncbi:MAG: chromosome segregation protein SMC, partial [Verrucomicrobia bacterium]